MSNLVLDDKGVITACSSCGKRNRVPYERLSETGECGQCKSELSAMSEPISIESEAHFQQVINRSALPVLIDFWAPWCRPCLMVAPEVEKVAQNGAGTFLVGKVNTENLQMLGQRLQIASIPTMAVYKGGQELARLSGARPAADIEAFVRQTIKP